MDLLQFGLEEMVFKGLSAVHVLSTRVGGKPHRKVLVNGSPKTGTTWMLKMIVSLPGYRHAGNFRGEIERYRSTAAGDVVHGHDFFTPKLKALLNGAEVRRVMTVRDPRDQAVSRMFHVRRETRHPWHAEFMELDDEGALMACIEGRDQQQLPGVRAMMRITSSWQQQDPDILIIRYEDLLAAPFEHMVSVFRHLEIPVSDRMIRAVIQRNRFRRMTVGRRFWRKSRRPNEEDSGSHYRKGVQGDWKNFFRAAHIERFKTLAGQDLIDWGYEKDLNW